MRMPHEFDLREHMEFLFGKVHECSFARKFGELLECAMEKVRIQKKIEVVEQKGLIIADLIVRREKKKEMRTEIDGIEAKEEEGKALPNANAIENQLRDIR